MNNYGYSTVETAIVFPVFMLLVAVLMILLVSFALAKEGPDEEEKSFIHMVYLTDSIKRKAEMISDVLE